MIRNKKIINKIQLDGVKGDARRRRALQRLQLGPTHDADLLPAQFWHQLDLPQQDIVF